MIVVEMVTGTTGREGILSAAFYLLPFIKFNRKSVRVCEEGVFFVCERIDTDWFD